MSDLLGSSKCHPEHGSGKRNLSRKPVRTPVPRVEERSVIS